MKVKVRRAEPFVGSLVSHQSRFASLSEISESTLELAYSPPKMTGPKVTTSSRAFPIHTLLSAVNPALMSGIRRQARVVAAATGRCICT